MILLIVSTRIMYRFGAFEENRTTDSDMDMLQHLLHKQDRPGSGILGVCFLSVLGSVCSEGKYFAYLRLFFAEYFERIYL